MNTIRTLTPKGPGMKSHNFKEKNHTFVYGTVCGVWQAFCWFPTLWIGCCLPQAPWFYNNNNNNNYYYYYYNHPYVCNKSIEIDICLCGLLGLDDCPNFKKPLWHGHCFTLIIFWVTSLHHIHYCGVHDTSLVKKPLIWLYFVWSRGLVVCATRKRQN